MFEALRPRGLLLLLGTTLVLAACGANGEGAPGSAGCPVGAAASTCSGGSSSESTSNSSCNTALQGGADSFTDPVAITTTLSDGLKYGDFLVGCGTLVKTGMTVSVNYTGWLQSNGTQFDTSRQGGRGPFSVTLGQHQVIAGWDEGIPGMRVGGKRRLIIPPALAYGANGYPPTIPANASLVFDIEVLSAR
jgi:FKBP-type peptidyl-prolyl cis-trans isomerase